MVKLSSIGDIVHTLPTLAAIRSALPEAEISWAVERTSAEILRNNPLLTRLIEVDTRSLRRKSVLGKTIMTARKQLRNLRASDFDLAIDFQGLIKSASISRFSGARYRAGFDKPFLREPSSRHLYTRTFKVEPGIHVIQQNLQLAAKAIGDFTNREDFSLENERLSFPVFTGPSDIRNAKALVDSTDGEFAILNPAGGWATKLWSAENYGKLADRLWSDHGISSLICTAPFEKPLAERAIAASESGRVRLVHPPLKEFFEL
ncbi:MAG: glycosyltransferase family 9 protein, partial [Acidobacteriota bacterium]|nr:glycosyltransferase family 9 protein [Acidobacteriota bacterium]